MYGLANWKLESARYFETKLQIIPTWAEKVVPFSMQSIHELTLFLLGLDEDKLCFCHFYHPMPYNPTFLSFITSIELKIAKIFKERIVSSRNLITFAVKIHSRHIFLCQNQGNSNIYKYMISWCCLFCTKTWLRC